jgi:protein tyrosine/serine phosphatase
MQDHFTQRSNSVCETLANTYISGNTEQLTDMLETFRNADFKNLSHVQQKYHNSISQLLDHSNSEILRSYPVIPNHLYAGEIPSSINDHEFQLKIQYLKELGITHIINLTEINEQNFKGIPLRNYAGYAEMQFSMSGMELNCFCFPIKDLDIPTSTHMRTIIKAINEAIHEGGKVYVHCWGGIGRTGTVIGCFLIEHGILLNQTAVPFIEFLKRNTEIKNRQSPETTDQVNYVLRWNQYL